MSAIGFGSKGSRCRLCDKQLIDVSDIWAGRCNDDDKCAERVRFIASVKDAIPVRRNVESARIGGDDGKAE